MQARARMRMHETECNHIIVLEINVKLQAEVGLTLKSAHVLVRSLAQSGIILQEEAT